MCSFDAQYVDVAQKMSKWQHCELDCLKRLGNRNFSLLHSGLFQLKNGHFCFIFRHFWYFGNVRKLLFLTLFWPFLGIFKCFRPLQLKWLRRYGQKINLSLLQFLPFFIISFKKPKNWKINIFIFFAESPKVFELQRHTIPSL